MASVNARLAHSGENLAHQETSPDAISVVTYRSRAVVPMSELDLHRLARAAQLRNLSEGVTGLLVYESGWVFQRIEGPKDGLARIWASIRRDPRHASIEVLSEGPADQRDFGDWAMRLSVHGAQAGVAHRGMADEPPELISRLYRGEEPVGLLGFCGLPAFENRLRPAAASEALLMSRAILADLIATVIVPRLCAARPTAVAEPVSLAATLASLLIAADPTAAFALVEAALCRYVGLGTLATNLLEPAARGLGDLWQSDDCSEIEVTLGLIRLQAIAREFGLGAPRSPAMRPPVVLVTPQPGEAHMLGAALDAEMLWQAGWSPQVDFPSSSGALETLVANSWIDALDLSLSTSFQRDHRLVQVGRTIAGARLASLNPDIVVVVSGRLFSDTAEDADPAAMGRSIGADATFGSASQAQSTILQALRLQRFRPI